MKQRKIIQCIQNENSNISAIDTIKAIKNAGFDGVFAQWYNNPEWTVSQKEQLEFCQNNNIYIEFVHLGYKNLNDIWLDGEVGEQKMQSYFNDLEEMAKFNIHLVIMHMNGGANPPEISQIGLERFTKIVRKAEQLNIKIAFENTRKWGMHEFIFDNIQSDNIGICFDVGHCHCHYKDNFNWERFKNKIFAVHLHDNDGSGDQHLLPFDGTIDWKYFISKLKEAGYDGPITLESCYRNNYLTQSLDDFYKESFKKAQIISNLFEN